MRSKKTCEMFAPESPPESPHLRRGGSRVVQLLLIRRAAIVGAPIRINAKAYTSKRMKRRTKNRSPVAARSFLFFQVISDVASNTPEKKLTYNDVITIA